MSEERKQELEYKKKILYGKIRELASKKNSLEMQISELKTEYSVIDRELAEMNITYCQPGQSGKDKPKQVTLSMDQVRDLAAKLGVNLEE